MFAWFISLVWFRWLWFGSSTPSIAKEQANPVRQVEDHEESHLDTQLPHRTAGAHVVDGGTEVPGDDESRVVAHSHTKQSKP
ncbi:hypothetical protein PAXINDRAFT_101853, partial [Paxillus involutus ATCC 200175]